VKISLLIRLAALFSVPFLLGSTPAPEGVTTVIVVRHAEAETGSADPGLSEAGKARAAALAARLADREIAAVYTSQFRRTRDTGAAVTSAQLVPVEIGREDIEGQSRALAKRVVEEHRGGVVVIVGHSNTVPAVVEALTGTVIEPIAHDEHSRIYTISIDASGARLEAGHFGAK
jgi:broad specificity phosphatase PhoE